MIPLHALLTERNVTRAAERLSMAQPSMSTALGKLRRLFDDPLLVREGRSLALTPLAESLLLPVQAALEAAKDVLYVGRSFDPAAESRTFTVMASDYCATVLLRPALRCLLTEAPGIRLHVEPLRVDVTEAVRSRRCDLLLWPLTMPEQDMLQFPHVALLQDEFVAAVDATNPLRGPLTAQDLAQLPAVQVAALGDRVNVPQGRLVERGVRQPVAVLVDTFGQALQMVAGTDLVTLTQRRLFQALGPGLGLREVPLATPMSLSVGAFWHPRNTQDPANAWLRAHLAGVAGKLTGASPVPA